MLHRFWWRIVAGGLRSSTARGVMFVVTAAAVAGCDGRFSKVARAESPITSSRAAESVRDAWAADVRSFRTQLEQLDSASTAFDRDPTAASLARAKQAFLGARLAFKRIEFLSAYYEPSTTRAINGPALPRVDDEEGPETIFAPEGLQVIEELLYSESDTASRRQLVNETRNVLAYVARLHNTASRQLVTDDRVFDAAKLEIARIVSLGITGFDSPIALHSLPEAAAALSGVRDALAAYRNALGERRWLALDGAFASAGVALQRAPSFERFDRLAFIAGSANPLARALVDARNALAIGLPVERRAFRVSATTPFDSGAFDAQAFAAPQTDAATPAQVALGRTLFFDARLSGGGDVACASCHDPDRAFTDGRTRARSRTGTAALRNSPTILNAGLQVGSFYDLRTTYLEDQVTDVMRNAEEMHGSVDAAAAVLSRDSMYNSAFNAAFPHRTNAATTGLEVRSAVAAYVRSLVALNSRVDRAFRGDTSAITAEERVGLNLFMGKAKCATCHFAPLFNGTVPPMYAESEVEVLGVPASPAVRGARIDPDSGRFRVTRSAPHLYAFKTPSVRNIALTAPYMHNGVYRTLDAVVDFYNRGGGAGIGIALPNQTLPADTLGLTRAEQRAVVRFMQALTDTAGVSASAEARAYLRRYPRSAQSVARAGVGRR
jgi:cytochrome c peroxidase